MKYPIQHQHSIHTHLNILKRLWYRELPHVQGIERWLAIVVAVMKLFFPMRWIAHRARNKWPGAKHTALDIYMIMKACVLVFLLTWIAHPTIAIIIALYILGDVVQFFLGLVALSPVYTKLPVIRKNFAHLMLNVGEIVMGFAVIYLYTHSVWTGGIAVTSGIDAAYFSIVTFATIGFGDIIPLGSLGRGLVIGETLISFLFVTIIVSSFVSGLTMKGEE